MDMLVHARVGKPEVLTTTSSSILYSSHKMSEAIVLQSNYAVHMPVFLLVHQDPQDKQYI